MKFNYEATLCCANGHQHTMSLSAFQKWLTDSDYQCLTEGCNEDVELLDGVDLRCYICHETTEFSSFDEARCLLDEKCCHCCGPHDFPEYSLCVDNSWQFWYGCYDWSARGSDESELERAGRTDYWEGLVHFCRVDEFIAIYRDREIRASSTGYFNMSHPEESKAVCLTEATRDNWRELQNRHGEYGFVFRKRDIIGQKGRPAIYLPDDELDRMMKDTGRICRDLRPYVNALRIPSSSQKQRHDWLHEREWRVARSIKLDVTKPYAVVFPKQQPNIADEVFILQAALEFQELASVG